MQARFLQVDANGNSIGGNVWMDRPGRMRFEYDPPDKMLLVAGHGLLVYYDPAVRQTTNIFLSSTPFGLAAAGQSPPLRAGDRHRHRPVHRADPDLPRADGEAGERHDHADFRDRPADAAQLDHPRRPGAPTQISLYDVKYGGNFPDSMFTFVGPQFEH